MPPELFGPIGILIVFFILIMGSPRKRDMSEAAERCRERASEVKRISCELGEKAKRH